ncbi:MAG: HEAT repeat domain-containing protein [Alphaproteobacteria bacterium]|nr:HEAT repeat domain-containing protein [Alphaproteobacteria bacterium]
MQPRPGLAAILAAAILCAPANPAAANETPRSAAYEAQTANLKSHRPEVRMSAVRALARLEEDEEVLAAVPLIVGLLVDEMPEVRIVTARQLGRLGDLAAEAVPALGQALRDEAFHAYQDDGGGVRYQGVALAAADALANIGPPAGGALADLLEALRAPDPRLRAVAAEAIGYIGEDANGAAMALAGALSDGRPEVRFEAALALAHIGPLPATVTAALLLALDDVETFTKGLPSGAEIVGSVREAAAEALLTINEGNLSQIKRAGGAVRDPDKAEAELPWRAGQRLTLTVDEGDVRDVLAVILRTNGMTARFRRDVGGVLTFDFKGMPAQGAFNMLLNEFNLTYDWQPARRQVSFTPFESVVFPKAGKRLVAARAKPPVPRKRPAGKKPKPAKTSVKVAAKTPTRPAPPAKPRTLKKPASPPTAKPAPKRPATAKPRTLKKPVSPPAAKPSPKRLATAKPPSKPKPAPAAPPAKVATRKVAAVKPVPARRAAPTQSLPKPATAKKPIRPAPAKLAAIAEPTDISGEHKLSFIIKIDGVYHAMIDGEEYTAGGVLPTGRGEMVITDIGKRSVFLLMKSADGAAAYVIKKKRRRRR